MIELQSFFLLNFYDNLLGNIESILRYFNSLSTSKWGDHLMLSEQSQMLWDALDINNFYFLFLLFSDFIGILFSFSFLLDDEEACDIEVT